MDFTIEVERALRVLDGAVLVLCGVSGVQSQSSACVCVGGGSCFPSASIARLPPPAPRGAAVTVDRQMKRYNVPRLAFVNKLDRQGSNPAKIVRDLQTKLRLNAALTQLPIGLEDAHRGVVDLVTRKAFTFEGPNGVDVTEAPVRAMLALSRRPHLPNSLLRRPRQVPADMAAAVETARAELVGKLVDVDDELGEVFLADEVGAPSSDAAPPRPLDSIVRFFRAQEPTVEQIKAAIRRATIALKFVPVFLGSAYKNKGVQLLLDGVVDYLPDPTQKANFAMDRNKDEEPVQLASDPKAPLVALAFKLEESRFGQLTYMRLYSGTLRKGDVFYNVDSKVCSECARLGDQQEG